MPAMPTADPEQFYQGAPLLVVPDVPATADWYREVLGFRSDPEGTSPGYTVVWRDNASVHLAGGGERAPGGVRIFFWVRDADAVHAEVCARGAEVVEPIGTRPHRIRDFSIRDPNGVILVFGQDVD